jgi:hypothetical protein
VRGFLFSLTQEFNVWLLALHVEIEIIDPHRQKEFIFILINVSFIME